ncbi:Vesicle-associated membrane protein 8 [Apodemus speciosus]|uniref:Vesicle-associated membrane protein 8 n=2 Tax=Murinae TaxID=39107 RepID=A0ABQ0EVH7_APOSI
MEEGSGSAGNDRVRNLQSEVEGVKNIMTQNVERILARGENLDHLRNKTEDLEATRQSAMSEHFKTTSQKVARKFWWKNVKMIVIICVIVLIIVILIILFATGTIPT